MKASVCLALHELGVDRQDPSQLQASSKQLTVDFAEPIYTSLLPSLDALFKPPKGHSNEYCFQVFEATKRPPAHWLHASLPLSEQGVPPGALLLVIPITCLTRFSARSIKGLDKEGFLIKQSIKSSKETGEKRRWIILKENFLLYYSSQNDTGAAGIVPLEYYNISDITLTILLSPVTGKKGDGVAAFELTPTGTLSKSNVVYRFVSDSEAEIKDWMRLIKERTANGVRKRVFGVPLTQLATRKGALVNDAVPLPLYKCVRFLDIRLRTEGLFRLSASGGGMESLRAAYDEGQDPDLTAIPGADPHTVAGLLKLYLRELPEPLLTFTLYETLLRSVDPFVQSQTQATRETTVPQLRALVQTLPGVHRGVLSFLITFLGRVAAEATVNLMHAANLAVVFAPNLLRPRDEESNVGLLVANSNHVNVVVQLLIEERSRIFDSGASSPQTRHVPSLSTSPNMASPLSTATAASAERSKLDLIVAGERVIALYDYTPAAAKELQLRKDEILTVLNKLDSGWLQAEKSNGNVGMVPITYVDLVPSTPTPTSNPTSILPAPAPAATLTPAATPAPVAKVATPKAKQLVRPPPPMTLPTGVAARPLSGNIAPTSATPAAPSPLWSSGNQSPLTSSTGAALPPPALASNLSSGSGSERSGSDRGIPAQVITFKPHAAPLKKPPALTLRSGVAPPPALSPPPTLNSPMRGPPVVPPQEALLPSLPPPVEDFTPAPSAPPVPERDDVTSSALEHYTPRMQDSSASNNSEEESSGRDSEKDRDTPPSPTPAVAYPILSTLARCRVCLTSSCRSSQLSSSILQKHPRPLSRPPSSTPPIPIAINTTSLGNPSTSPPPSPKSGTPNTSLRTKDLLPQPTPPPDTLPQPSPTPPRSPRSPRPISMQPSAVSPRGLSQSANANPNPNATTEMKQAFTAATLRQQASPSISVDVELLIQAMSSRIELLENAVGLLGRRLAEETRQREQLEARLSVAGVLSPIDGSL